MGADAPPVYPRQTESLIYVLYNTRQNPPKPLNEEFVSLTGSHISSITRVTLHISPFLHPPASPLFRKCSRRFSVRLKAREGPVQMPSALLFFFFFFKDFFTACAFELSLIERKD